MLRDGGANEFINATAVAEIMPTLDRYWNSSVSWTDVPGSWVNMVFNGRPAARDWADCQGPMLICMALEDRSRVAFASSWMVRPQATTPEPPGRFLTVNYSSKHTT